VGAILLFCSFYLDELLSLKFILKEGTLRSNNQNIKKILRKFCADATAQNR
jgi:hypothetical protein